MTENGFINTIIITIKGNKVNFIDIIKNKAKFLRLNHNDCITSFDSNFKFYLLKDKSDFVLAVKYVNKYSVEKIRYSLDGVVINRVIDNIDNNVVTRICGEKKI